MTEVVGFGAGILEIYNLFMSLMPGWLQNFINLFLLVLLVILYATFIWKLYQLISKKNIFALNFGQYNKFENPVLTKLVAGFFYFLEYFIILPLLIFCWFVIFTIFLMFLTEDLGTNTILIISATIITSIRMASFYNESLSKELAKMLPFTFLAVSILNPKFFDVSRIFTQFSALSGLFSQIFVYLLFIIFVEMLLRFFDFVFSLFDLNEKVVE